MFLLFPMDGVGVPCVTWAVSGLAMLNLPPIRIPSMRLLFAYDQLGVGEAGIFPMVQEFINPLTHNGALLCEKHIFMVLVQTSALPAHDISNFLRCNIL